MRIAPPEMLAARLGRLRHMLAARQLDALVVTSLPNIAYLTGFFASAAALVVPPDGLQLVGDGRYDALLKARADDWREIRPTVLSSSLTYDQAVVDLLKPLGGLKVGFEAAHLSVHRYRFLVKRLSGEAGWTGQLIETDGIVEELRRVKDAWEVDRLRDGAGRLSSVAKCILPKVLAGRTESDIAGELESEMRRVGFERVAFDTIVASGPNAALPHGRASQRRLESGDLVVVDCGGVLDGYCSDLTRTVVAGRPGERERRLIEQVTEAQAAAFQAVGPGQRPEAADAAARQILDGYGLGDAFTHGTGHGLGLEVHEGPKISRGRPERPEPPLAPGMVMTIEPGVYFPGWGGVRIEDDVLVTEGGAEWLTDVPRFQGSKVPRFQGS